MTWYIYYIYLDLDCCSIELSFLKFLRQKKSVLFADVFLYLRLNNCLKIVPLHIFIYFILMITTYQYFKGSIFLLKKMPDLWEPCFGVWYPQLLFFHIFHTLYSCKLHLSFHGIRLQTNHDIWFVDINRNFFLHIWSFYTKIFQKIYTGHNTCFSISLIKRNFLISFCYLVKKFIYLTFLDKHGSCTCLQLFILEDFCTMRPNLHFFFLIKKKVSKSFYN